MELQDIPAHPVESWMFPEAQALRSRAPQNLVAMIESGALENISSLADLQPGQVSVLNAGEVSACYLLKDNGVSSVVKFRFDGLEAEVESLNLWGQNYVPVPEIIAHGVIPQEQGDLSKPTKYFVEEAIVDESGSLSAIGYEFLKAHPEQASVMGARAGKILADMHKPRAEEGFGSFSDAWTFLGKNFDNFQDFSVSVIRFYGDFLSSEGFSSDVIDALLKSIRNTRFAEKPAYVHGDYGAHNILVRNGDPQDLVVIDPNPLHADPYWDLAAFIDRLNISKSKVEDYPEDTDFVKEYDDRKVFLVPLIEAYQSETGEPIDEDRMDAVRFVKLLFKVANSSRKAINKNSSEIDISLLGKKEKQAITELGYSRKMLHELAAKIIVPPIASTE